MSGKPVGSRCGREQNLSCSEKLETDEIKGDLEAGTGMSDFLFFF